MPSDDPPRIVPTPPQPPHDPPSRSAGYQGIFTLGGKPTKVPKWLPVSLLALTTAALAVPIVVMRRQRAAAGLTRALADAAPPPRRTVGGAPPPRATPATSAPPPRTPADAPPPRRASALPPAALSVPSRPSTSSSSTPPPSPELPPDGGAPEDNFNGAFYTLKAFGLATLFVTLGAGAGVWGVTSAMGVRDTKEFADRSRALVLEWMPKLSRRIYRRPEPEHAPHEEPPSQSMMARTEGAGGVEDVKWTWHEAEERLKAAYDRDGFMGWAEAALQELELEAEGHAERLRKGHT